jgi:ATP-dependent DNA helicase PIF1
LIQDLLGAQGSSLEKDICQCDKIFGGDFQQILPVMVKGSRPEIVNASIWSLYIWPQLKVLSLKINMRLGQIPEEVGFAKCQLDVGHGRHTDENGNINLPPYFSCPQNTVESLIDTIYPGISLLPHPPDHYFVERAILSAHNDDVDDLNHRILCDFPGEERVYLGADLIKENTADPETVLMYPTEYLNMITASGLPLHKLALKIGSPVMVLCNLNPSEGVCNNSRGIITRMTHHVLEL